MKKPLNRSQLIRDGKTVDAILKIIEAAAQADDLHNLTNRELADALMIIWCQLPLFDLPSNLLDEIMARLLINEKFTLKQAN